MRGLEKRPLQLGDQLGVKKMGWGGIRHQHNFGAEILSWQLDWVSSAFCNQLNFGEIPSFLAFVIG